MQPITLITATSYGLGAAAFAVLSLLLLTNWRGRLLGATFATATLINSAWLALLAVWPFYPMIPWQGPLVAEAVRDGAWLFLLARLLRASDKGSRRAAMLQLIALAAPLTWIGVALLPSGTPTGPATGSSIDNLIAGGLSLSIVGLVLLEQFCRNLAPERRWAVKFLCIGLGVQLGYDLLLYSQGLLYHRLDPALWAARGAVLAFSAPLLAVAAARNPSMSGNLFVSHRMVFHTAMLVAAGTYLLVMSAGGYYIRYLGGSWGSFWQILFVSVAAIALIVLVTSGQIQGRLRVFLLKHFHAYKYDYREEWNRLIDRLYRTGDTHSPYERVIGALGEIVDSPGGALWARRDSIARYAPVAAVNLRVSESVTETLDSDLAEFMRSRRWIIDTESYRAHPEQHRGLKLPDWLDTLPGWWLIVPLLQESELVAFVILTRPRAPRSLSWEDRDLLKAVGHQLAAYLSQYEAAQSLSQARQFQAFNQLSTFLMHDLKNLVAQQSLLVENAERHKHNPAFVDDMVATVDESVQRVNRLLAQLQSGHRTGNRVRLRVSEIAAEAIEKTRDRQPVPYLEPSDTAGNLYVSVEPRAFFMILQHIIRNAQDATADEGTVCVKISADGGEVQVDVIDTGSGMSTEFVRERLFRPFDSTKSSRGMGIGAYQAQTFAREHGGDVEVESAPGQGTRFRVRLPVAPETPKATTEHEQREDGPARLATQAKARPFSA